MEITEIIKESFIFPKNNIEKVGIYLIIYIIIILLTASGIVLGATSIYFNIIYAIIGCILLIMDLILIMINKGYEIDIISSGIKQQELSEDYTLNTLTKGIKATIIGIIYNLIPFIITFCIAILTYLPQKLNIANSYLTHGSGDTLLLINNLPLAGNYVPEELMLSILGSLMLTLTVGTILFLIFGFAEYMGYARLAKTDDLKYSLKIIEAFKDIRKIGIIKVVGTIILTNIILGLILIVLEGLSIVSSLFSLIAIIIIPYLIFVTKRVIGLLYSEIN